MDLKSTDSVASVNNAANRSYLKVIAVRIEAIKAYKGGTAQRALLERNF